MKSPRKHTWADGTQIWKLNGGLHRRNGPAVISTNGRQEWYLNGKLHRLDGPAIIYAGGYQTWWVNGKLITNDYDLTLFDSEEGRMILLLKYN